SARGSSRSTPCRRGCTGSPRTSRSRRSSRRSAASSPGRPTRRRRSPPSRGSSASSWRAASSARCSTGDGPPADPAAEHVVVARPGLRTGDNHMLGGTPRRRPDLGDDVGMTDAPDLPPRLALAWGVAERPERAPKRELSIERIVETAIEIADADGLGAVSMAKVAQRLGFTTMSLYRYVTSKDDLLLLMQEAALDVEYPPAHEPADWRAELR